MNSTTEQRELASLPQTLRQEWRTLLLLPAINLVLVVVFWQSQLLHYSQHTPTGVLMMWLVAGLLFLLIQLSLQYRAWCNARNTDTDGSPAYATRWLLAAQIIIFGIATVYNVAVLIQLSLLGIRPNQPLDFVIAGILAVTVIAALAMYGWRRFGEPKSRLLLATGTKAAPQWFQAIWFAVQGSAGFHVLTLTTITTMGTSRYLMTRATVKQFRDESTVAANKAAFRDLISIIAIAIGWTVGLYGGI